MKTVNKVPALPALALGGALALVSNPGSAQETQASVPVARQSLDDAWWTGPIIAAGAGTLPQGHALVEPYLYDVIRYSRFGNDGTNEARRARTTTDP